MIMKIMGFDFDVSINDEKTNLLIIEDNKLFGSVCFKLCLGLDEDIIFIENDKVVKNSVTVINDIINYDLNGKEFISKLFKQVISKIVNDNEKDDQIRSEFTNIISNIYDIIDEYNVDISLNDDIDYNKFLKLIGLQFDNSYTTIIDKMLDLLEIYSELFDESLVFINVLCLFDDNEINEILKYIKYKKLTVLFIENSYNRNIKFDDIYIIDNDFYDYVIE